MHSSPPDPRQFGLTSRTVLESVDDNTLAIVINRKSRIIMADAKKIRKKVLKITQTCPSIAVIVKTTAPVCSKTVAYLAEEGIRIEQCTREKAHD